MEASRFGFGEDMPPAFKFDPTDADLVASYLLPRALGLHNPHAHAIIEEDPGGVPPWEILARHGQFANEDHPVQAFFFVPPADASHNGGRRSRTVQGGGVWQGQKGAEKTFTLLRPGGGGGEVDIRYKMYHLTFCHTKNGPSTGYVMHEFEILSPPLPGAVLTRVKAKKGAYRPPGSGGADEQQEVIQVPGPSYAYDAGAQDGAMYDSNGYYLGHDLPVVQYDDSYSYSIQDQPGTSYNNYNAAAMMDDGGGFTSPQANAFCGGGAAETAGAYYDPSNPEYGAEYSNYSGEYQYNSGNISSRTRATNNRPETAP